MNIATTITLVTFLSLLSHSLSQVVDDECTLSDIDCSRHGICSPDNTYCICDVGFVQGDNTTFPQCMKVRQKRQTSDKMQGVAFLLSFFLGYLGVGRFYIENRLAIPKIIVTLIWIPVSCMMCCGALTKGKTQIVIFVVLVTIMIGCMAATVAWWLTDVILFAKNVIPDGDGNTLCPWFTC